MGQTEIGGKITNVQKMAGLWLLFVCQVQPTFCKEAALVLSGEVCTTLIAFGQNSLLSHSVMWASTQDSCRTKLLTTNVSWFQSARLQRFSTPVSIEDTELLTELFLNHKRQHGSLFSIKIQKGKWFETEEEETDHTGARRRDTVSGLIHAIKGLSPHPRPPPNWAVLNFKPSSHQLITKHTFLLPHWKTFHGTLDSSVCGSAQMFGQLQQITGDFFKHLRGFFQVYPGTWKYEPFGIILLHFTQSAINFDFYVQLFCSVVLIRAPDHTPTKYLSWPPSPSTTHVCPESELKRKLKEF